MYTVYIYILCRVVFHIYSIFVILLFIIIVVFSHIRSLGAAGALAVDICICFHDNES